MFRKYLLPLLALAGIGFATAEVIQNQKVAPPAPPLTDWPESPFPAFVAGAGLVEASSENISVGSPAAGTVAQIFVQIGQTVKAGEPLFQVDARAAQAELKTRRAAVRVGQVEAANARYDLRVAETLASTGVNAANDLAGKRFAAEKSDALLGQAEADLQAAETQLDLLTVRAPVDGQILQLKLHLGEFVPSAASSPAQASLLLGNVTPLQLRVEVNENDAWRVRAGAAGVGYLRGNPKIEVALSFVRFEPYVVPKATLTGTSTERVDTRVLQAIFRFDRGDLPIFVGQEMDVFIQIPPLYPNPRRNRSRRRIPDGNEPKAKTSA